MIKNHVKIFEIGRVFSFSPFRQNFKKILILRFFKIFRECFDFFSHYLRGSIQVFQFDGSDYSIV